MPRSIFVSAAETLGRVQSIVFSDSKYGELSCASFVRERPLFQITKFPCQIPINRTFRKQPGGIPRRRKR